MNPLMIHLAFVIVPIGFGTFLHNPAAEKNLQNRNKAVVRGYMDKIVNQSSWDEWDVYFAEKLTFNGSPIDKHQLKSIVHQMRRPLPNLQLTIEDQIAENDIVVTRVTFHGITPNGKPVEYMGIGIDRLSGGRVVEMWHLADEPSENQKR